MLAIGDRQNLVNAAENAQHLLKNMHQLEESSDPLLSHIGFELMKKVGEVEQHLNRLVHMVKKKEKEAA